MQIKQHLLSSIVLAIAIVFQPYIVRGLSGQWKKVGDSFGHGRQYDPGEFDSDGFRGTRTCIYSELITSWVKEDCFEENCDCSLPVEDPHYASLCLDCLDRCKSRYCFDT